MPRLKRGEEYTPNTRTLGTRLVDFLYPDPEMGMFGLPSWVQQAQQFNEATGYKPGDTKGDIAESLLSGFDQAYGIIPGMDPANLPMTGMLATFAGKGAKTADAVRLAAAEAMEKAGKSADDIWDQTGWFRGADDKWRFEIDDSLSQMPKRVQGTGRSGQLDAYLEHPDLYAAYPDTPQGGGIGRTKMAGDANIAGGSYDHRGNQITVGTAPAALRKGGSSSQHSVTLHEGQHAIQGREGFARGGNTVNALDEMLEEVNGELSRVADKISELRRSATGMTAPQRAPIDAEIAALKAQYDELLDFRHASASPSARYAAYRQLAGEVEARNVQKRMDMTPEERRAAPPWTTEDVPRENQIVRMDFTGPSLSEELPMDEASRMARARDMGFDTDVYHSTNYDFDEFSVKPWRGAVYTANNPEAAQRGARAGAGDWIVGGPAGSGEKVGEHIMPLKARGKIWGRDPLPEDWFPENITYGEYRDIISGKNKIDLPGFSEDELKVINSTRRRAFRDAYTEAIPENQWGPYTTASGDTADNFPLKRENVPPANRIGYEDFEGTEASAFVRDPTISNKGRRELIKKLGYSGAVVSDESGSGPNMTIAIFDPKNIRSRFAKFDPSKADSSDLLASLLVGGTAAGLGGSMLADELQRRKRGNQPLVY